MLLIGVVSEDEVSPKNLAPEQSFLSVDGDSLVVSAVKKADKGDGLVVRLYEESGQRVNTAIHFLGRDQSFFLCNLLEENSGHRPEQTLQANHCGTVVPNKTDWHSSLLPVSSSLRTLPAV